MKIRSSSYSLWSSVRWWGWWWWLSSWSRRGWARRFCPPDGKSWRRIVVPIIGALSTGFLLYRYFPEARGSGIPQTKAALYAQGGFISFRTIFGKFFCSSTSLASGIALGREGPSVHVGAGIASVLGRTLGLPREKVQALLPVGSSAALAAAFNTPIAAVLFALEEVVGNLHAPVLGSVVLSSATSWLVLRLMLGDEPLFHVPEYQVVHPIEFVIYAFLGLDRRPGVGRLRQNASPDARAVSEHAP